MEEMEIVTRESFLSDECVRNPKVGECSNKVKIEDLDILEQFIDEDGIHDRREYVVKSEYKDISCPFKQIDKEESPAITLEETHQDIKLERHIDVKQGKYRCQLCDYVANLKSHLKSHMECVHLNLKQYKCHMCDYAANQKTNLKHHVDSIHLNLNQHKCHICDFVTNWKSYLKNHIDSLHSSLKQHKCHMCDYATKWKSYLKQHINSVHSKLKQHKCHMCDYATNWKSNLKSHVDSVHLKLKCALRRHIDYDHSNSKQHKCHMCNFATNWKSNLKKHVDRIHSCLKRHKCHVCNYATNKKYDLKYHFSVQHPEDGECSIKVKIEDVDVLEQFIGEDGIHDRRDYVVKSDNKDISYALEQVNKEKSSTIKIEATHQDIELERNIDVKQKNYRCQFCDYAADQKNNFLKHMDSDHDLKCHMCDFATNWKSTLKNHVYSAHFI